MTAFGRVALDGEEVPAPSNGDDWRLAWHPPPAPPPGEPHGANAFCVTADGDVVLISSDGARWGWPGGRPEPGESWQQTLERRSEGLLPRLAGLGTAARPPPPGSVGADQDHVTVSRDAEGIGPVRLAGRRGGRRMPRQPPVVAVAGGRHLLTVQRDPAERGHAG